MLNFQIKLIILKESYNGPSGMYADDISVIVLASNVTIGNSVWPASIDWSTAYSPSNGDLGKVHSSLSNIIMTYLR